MSFGVAATIYKLIRGFFDKIQVRTTSWSHESLKF